MRRVVTPEQMRRVDAAMIEGQGIPGILLMEHAAAAVAREVRARQPEGGEALILCGGGNNGGDGLAVLRQLAMHGVRARAALLVSPASLKGDAKAQYEMARACGLCVEAVLDEAAANALALDAALVVDALFGTGLARDVEGRFALLIERVNRSGLPVVAVDIPSGVDGATGRVRGAALRASATVTFQFPKYGHLLYPGRALCGEVTVAPIGLPDWEEESAWQLSRADVAALLPPRRPDSHKGSHGRGVLCAGSGPYAGAALLSATAALRGGCGLLRVLTPKSVHPYLSACAGAIAQPVGEGDCWDAAACAAAQAAIAGMDALALGPGMGQGDGIPALLRAALQTGKPLVVDADGLNALACARGLFALLHKGVILTPHPGEMARLLGCAQQDVLADPVGVAQAAARAWGCTVILKGATSVIAGERLTLNTTGNAGLAKGGSGDVLTGLLLALLCQGLAPYDAACAGAYLLGAGAEEALSLLGNRMLSPMDVTEALLAMLPELHDMHHS